MTDLPDLGSRWHLATGEKVVVITTAVYHDPKDPLVIYCPCGSTEPNQAVSLFVWRNSVTSAETKKEPSSPATHVGASMSVEAKKKRVTQLLEKQERQKADLTATAESLKTARAELREEEKKEKAAQKAKKPALAGVSKEEE